ncbi:hypothetical protein FRB94_000488 [Tulasnella sp. JGI-2019a]|nr:hypothetical protein FRB93_010563 [Tulasnella sp. JGI-2019a]KAG9006653.1 hypothetical protein FRB94_000488 [Tulasnella sp. JGI-2019a]
MMSAMIGLQGISAAVTLFMDHSGAPGQLLLNGTSTQTFNTAVSGLVWNQDCQRTVISTGILSYGSHLIALQQTGSGTLYFGNFV